AHDLLDRPRAPGAGLDRGVVRHDGDRAPVHAPDAGDDAVGREVARERVDEQAVLDPFRMIAVEQARDPVAAEQLALLRVLLVVLLGAAALNGLDRGGELAVLFAHVRPLLGRPHGGGQRACYRHLLTRRLIWIFTSADSAPSPARDASCAAAPWRAVTS